MSKVGIRQWRYLTLTLLSGIALYLIVSGGYIYAKAQVAQWLIKDAWQQTLDSNQWQLPWSWADTWPVAKLNLKNKELYILEGASGRVLAFGPGHISQTPLPMQQGNTVVVGHRDTHFRILEGVEKGEILSLETRQGHYQYQVTKIQIVNQDRIDLLQNSSAALLTLITCYPFDSLTPDTPLRYVVQASLLN
ncbi:class GN sortase [Neptunicella sp. SCSIO 80796]|uniref:class GN sortase n=1 Tax=Neptunicella plasticusilytica TaxID=3117012 RepID=UPI003A4D8457